MLNPAYYPVPVDVTVIKKRLEVIIQPLIKVIFYVQTKCLN